MLDKDFDMEYEKFYYDRCPIGISNQPKALGCFNAMEKHGEYSDDKKCRRCWKAYVNQREPADTGEQQGELFGGDKESGWISVKEKEIPWGEQILAGLFKSNGEFEQRMILIDEDGEIRDADFEYDSAWEISDYMHWKPLDQPGGVEG